MFLTVLEAGRSPRSICLEIWFQIFLACRCHLFSVFSRGERECSALFLFMTLITSWVPSLWPPVNLITSQSPTSKYQGLELQSLIPLYRFNNYLTIPFYVHLGCFQSFAIKSHGAMDYFVHTSFCTCVETYRMHSQKWDC